MLKIQALLYVTFIFLSFSGAHPATISIKNNCPYKIWPASLTAVNKPQLALTGFELASGASSSVDTPVPWTGRFWARTNCKTISSGKFTCGGDTWGSGPYWNEVLAPSLFTCDSPGDCASGQVACNGNGGNPPVTIVEFNIAGGGGQDFYDVSLVDGFNLPVSVTPQGGNGDCGNASCTANLNANCPSELQVKKGDGSVVGCKSACIAFNESKYCCTPPNETPETCPPTNYSKMFSQQCPDAYSYAYDDLTGTFTCSGSPDYTITFCP
ncbi:hypothetical protein M0R45_030623 [Rubus argutus]|uniref:Uncharacterized protein n=1 Tax=Rubus argutus TaxID=59490 RepID=A0AAW1WDP4_RUBAR